MGGEENDRRNMKISNLSSNNVRHHPRNYFTLFGAPDHPTVTQILGLPFMQEIQPAPKEYNKLQSNTVQSNLLFLASFFTAVAVVALQARMRISVIILF